MDQTSTVPLSTTPGHAPVRRGAPLATVSLPTPGSLSPLIHAGRASSRAPPRASEPRTPHGRRRWGSRARHRREPSSSGDPPARSTARPTPPPLLASCRHAPSVRRSRRERARTAPGAATFYVRDPISTHQPVPTSPSKVGKNLVLTQCPHWAFTPRFLGLI